MAQQKTKSVSRPRFNRPILPDLKYEYLGCDYEKKTIDIYIENGRGIGVFEACEDFNVVRVGYVSTGAPGKYKTPRGDFKIQWKAKKYDSKKYPSTNGGRNMDYAMFYNDGFAMHKGNINKLSHGCVRTHTTQAQWLYDWAPHGTRIIIRDM
jgi:lipoprotein-anchoring transpeptidase ErfK/SrfK